VLLLRVARIAWSGRVVPLLPRVIPALAPLQLEGSLR
jgi:hypothetical protein